MKNLYLLILALLSFGHSALGTHLIGGEITYDFMGRTSSNELEYKVSVHLLRDCIGTIPFDDNLVLGVYEKSSGDRINVLSLSRILTQNRDLTCNVDFFKERSCTEYALYETIITFPSENETYVLSYIRCCRNSSKNLSENDEAPSQGIELRALIATEYENSCAPSSFIRAICLNNEFSWNPSNIDQDGDSVVYSIAYC